MNSVILYLHSEPDLGGEVKFHFKADLKKEIHTNNHSTLELLHLSFMKSDIDLRGSAHYLMCNACEPSAVNDVMAPIVKQLYAKSRVYVQTDTHYPVALAEGKFRTFDIYLTNSELSTDSVLVKQAYLTLRLNNVWW